MIDLGTVDAAALVGLDLFAQVLRELQHRGALPVRFDVAAPGGAMDAPRPIRIEFAEPRFEVGAESPVELVLPGVVHIAPAGDTEGSNAAPQGVEARVALAFLLKPGAGSLPALGLVLEGPVSVAPEVAQDAVEGYLQEAGLAESLAAVTIDLATPLVAALEAQLFAVGAAPPPREEWSTSVDVVPAGGDAPACVSVRVARPGRGGEMPSGPSPLPALCDFAVVFSRDVMSELMDIAEAEARAADAGGAKLMELTVEMGDEAILVGGVAQHNGVPTPFGGTVDLSMHRGTTAVWADARSIDATTQLSWNDYAGALAAGLLAALGPVGLIVDGPWLAPLRGDGMEMKPGGLAAALVGGLAALAAGLDVTGPAGAEVSTAWTPDHLAIVDGNVLLAAQVFVEPIEQPIRDGRYDRSLERIVYLELDSGRGFRPSELARLMELGKVVVPDHHSVDGRYVRSDPDSTEANNLLQLLRGG